MKVRVVSAVWGNYVKGDVIDMQESTAIACIKHKVVEDAEKEPKKEKEPKV